jgi:hypothetical protein
MKTLFYWFAIYIIFINNICYAQVQNNEEVKQIKQVLREFYIAYNKAWSTTKNMYIIKNQVDSLQIKYCTKKLRNELRSERKESGFGYEPLIKDEYAEVLNMLTVTKDSTRSNVYIVSYCYPTINASYKPINKTVTFHVLMMEEEGSFKIDSVW